MVSNFCLIGKIRHNFLLPRVIELGRKTFMPIQTLDLHRVIRGNKKDNIPVFNCNSYFQTKSADAYVKLDDLESLAG